MQTTQISNEELREMQDNVREAVNSLEQCWCCVQISECKQGIVDDAAPVWLCGHCQTRCRAAASRRRAGWAKCHQ